MIVGLGTVGTLFLIGIIWEFAYRRPKLRESFKKVVEVKLAKKKNTFFFQFQRINAYDLDLK
jgi:hypothetical protein